MTLSAAVLASKGSMRRVIQQVCQAWSWLARELCPVGRYASGSTELLPERGQPLALSALGGIRTCDTRRRKPVAGFAPDLARNPRSATHTPSLGLTDTVLSFGARTRCQAANSQAAPEPYEPICSVSGYRHYRPRPVALRDLGMNCPSNECGFRNCS